MQGNKNTESEYSPLVQSIKAQFDRHSAGGYSALFVCVNPWGAPSVNYVPVAQGAWPWAVLDESAAMRHDPLLVPILAFNLKQEFEAQMPENLRQIEVFDSLWMRPIINIPDRKGINMEERRKQITEKALEKRPPSLRLIVNNR